MEKTNNNLVIEQGDLSRRSFIKAGVGLTAATGLKYSNSESLYSMTGSSGMYVGFLTGGLQNLPLEDVIVWASQNGFKALEVPCDPPTSKKNRHLAVESFTNADAEKLKSLLQRYNLTISAIGNYSNNLDQNLSARESSISHLRKIIDAAFLLGVQNVGTFVGRDNTKTIEQNVELAKTVMTPVIRYAGDKGINVVIENCPMQGWHPESLPGQIFYSPEIWKALFDAIGEKNFGLNFDPSHLYWQQIDYVQAVKDFRARIFHTHAKDTEILQDGLNKYGTFGKMLNKKSAWDNGWWLYRIPGFGSVDWKKYFAALKEINYTGVVSIEHEDPSFSGTEVLFKEGLVKGGQFLSLYI